MVVLATLLLIAISDSKHKASFIVIGCFIAVVGTFLTGPSRIFGFPDQIGIITAGMITSGIGKAIISTFAPLYTITSGQETFSEEKEEVERRVPLMITASCGIGGSLVPVAISAFYKAINFRTTLDILGVVLSVITAVFTLHTVKKKWEG